MPWFHIQWVPFLPIPSIFAEIFATPPPITCTLHRQIIWKSLVCTCLFPLGQFMNWLMLQRDRENLGESRFMQERKTAKNYRHSFSDFSDESFMIEKEKDYSTHILVFRHDCTDKSQIQSDVWFQRPLLFQPVYCHSCQFVLFYQNKRAGCDVFSERQWRWCRACSLLRASCTIHGQPGARE